MNSIFVVDLESTCWEKHKYEVAKRADEESEIIEIGWAWLNIIADEYDIVGSGSILVKPRYSKVSEFCTQLTGHTQEVLDESGIDFVEAVKYLNSLNIKKIPWSSFGEYDKKMLENQCKRFDIEYPMCRTHHNIKNLVSLVTGKNKGVGLKRAVAMMGLQFEGRNHSGIDDAVNAARVLGEIVKKFRKVN